jgi:hypothetical protein
MDRAVDTIGMKASTEIAGPYSRMLAISASLVLSLEFSAMLPVPGCASLSLAPLDQ